MSSCRHIGSSSSAVADIQKNSHFDSTLSNSNAQLVKEHTSLAAAYNNKSVAEQNSVDIAWDLLMEDCFKELRRTIYCNEVEFKRFRQLIVNTVLATGEYHLLWTLLGTTSLSFCALTVCTRLCFHLGRYHGQEPW